MVLSRMKIFFNNCNSFEKGFGVNVQRKTGQITLLVDPTGLLPAITGPDAGWTGRHAA